jgi:hypothetical protein
MNYDNLLLLLLLLQNVHLDSFIEQKQFISLKS